MIGGVADLIAKQVMHLVLRCIVRVAMGGVGRDGALD
jgi:hypothetical protein